MTDRARQTRRTRSTDPRPGQHCHAHHRQDCRACYPPLDLDRMTAASREAASRQPAPISNARGRLHLACGPTGWAVDYRDTDQAEAYRQLFGGTVIPLPYTPRASASQVLTQVHQIEPETVITLEGEEY